VKSEPSPRPRVCFTAQEVPWLTGKTTSISPPSPAGGEHVRGPREYFTRGCLSGVAVSGRGSIAHTRHLRPARPIYSCCQHVPTADGWMGFCLIALRDGKDAISLSSPVPSFAGLLRD
jgi:hypothetical protein